MIRLALLASLVTACLPMTQAHEQRLDQLCSNQRAAYEDGYTKGISREPMSTAWIDQSCVPQNREAQRQAFTTGYQTGIQYAPATANVNYAAGYALQPAFGYAAPAQDCRLNSDGSQRCGYNCRLGSDGYHHCASSPVGQCVLDGDGSWACP